MAAVTDTNVYEPHQWKHSTIVAGVEWKNPVGTASGTFQLAACRWFYDVSQMGAICTKGVSPEPWQGNPGPRTAETPAGMVNSVGLQNPGVDHYLVDELPKLKDLGATVITNVAGHSDDEYAEVVAKLADSRADMLEINVSCPNVNHGGMSVGTDPEALHRLIDRLRKITSKPMIVKLSPNVTDITTIARAAVDAHAGRHAHRHPHRRTDPLEPHGRRVRPGDLPDRAELRVARASGAARHSDHRHRRHRLGGEGTGIPVCGRERRRGRRGCPVRSDGTTARGPRARRPVGFKARTCGEARSGGDLEITIN
mgnify:CR=1 FL=1